MTARSTVPGMSATRAYARNPWMRSAPGCTGTMVPVNPAAWRLWRISAPIPPRCRLAPTTATVRGSKKAFIDARRRQLRSPRGLLEVVGCDLERQLDVKDAAIHPARHAIARIEEYVDHLAVLGQHEGIERPDLLRPSDVAQALEQPCPDARPCRPSAIANATSARSSSPAVR